MLWQWENSGENGGRQVFILDLDGTLMPSADIDNVCYWQAVYECYELPQRLPDLHDFNNVTDSSILDEWCVRQLGRSPHEDEVNLIKLRFVELLETAHAEQPRHFTTLPGVVQWLQAVSKQPHIFTGIATGGWELSARLKLKLSGLERFDLPLASSDDALTRTGIMQTALKRTVELQGSDQPLISYVGDGAWDLQASRQLGWRFIAIASGDLAGQFRLSGADQIRTDFRK